MQTPSYLRRHRVGIAVLVVLIVILAGITVSGLAGNYRQTCKTDAQRVESAIQTYHDVTGTWPPAGPVDRSSVLLRRFPHGTLRTSPQGGDKYSINTDGAGGVLVAVPPARSGGSNYGDTISGGTNPCDAVDNL